MFSSYNLYLSPHLLVPKAYFISAYDFHVPDGKKEEYLFRITDVGGEAMERQKWFEIIEHYTMLPERKPICMIFLVAVDEYDTQVIYQDRTRNRLRESRDIFGQLRRLHWIPRETNFILFLNKDFLETMRVESSLLKACTCQIKGRGKETDCAIRYILTRRVLQIPIR